MKLIKKIIYFYIDGFKNLDNLGIKIWIFIMFAILKIFFFPDFLDSKFNSDKEKGNYVIKTLTKK
jgi:hypothetical protein